MADLRSSLSNLPMRMKKLPLDARGYPVPWFVKWVEGKPNFRLIDPEKFIAAMRFNRCWVCGEGLGAKKTFVIGPLNILNRVNSEPPSHWECAAFAVTSCPFLLLPKAQYQETENFAPHQLMRNPGVSALWSTRDYQMSLHQGLIEFGEPSQVWWFAQGKLATRAQVIASLESGLPWVWARAKRQANYIKHCIEIEQQWAAALSYLPQSSAFSGKVES
jgi:hypothetical protein